MSQVEDKDTYWSKCTRCNRVISTEEDHLINSMGFAFYSNCQSKVNTELTVDWRDKLFRVINKVIFEELIPPHTENRYPA